MPTMDEYAARYRDAIADAISTLEQIEMEMHAGFGSSFGETREQVRRTIKRLRAVTGLNTRIAQE